MELLNRGKILVFDIETSDFKANFGYMLMYAAKFVGEDYIYSGTIAQNPDYRSSPSLWWMIAESFASFGI
jgi:hypothetical protein